MYVAERGRPGLVTGRVAESELTEGVMLLEPDALWRRMPGDVLSEPVVGEPDRLPVVRYERPFGST